MKNSVIYRIETQKGSCNLLFCVYCIKILWFAYSGFDEEVVPPSPVARFVDDPSFGYQDFARHGEDNPPTFKAQVWQLPSRTHIHSIFLQFPIENEWLIILSCSLYRTTHGRIMVSLWSTDCTLTLVTYWMISSERHVIWPITTWPVTRGWTPACCAGLSSTTSTVCTASGTSMSV